MKKSFRACLACRAIAFVPSCSIWLSLLCSGQAWPAEQLPLPHLAVYGSLLHSGQAWPAEQLPLPHLAVYGSLLRSGQAWPAEQCLCPILQYMALSSTQDRLGLQSNAFSLPCSIWLSPPLRTGFAWPSSPAMLDGCFISCVALHAMYTPAIIVFFKKDGKIWGCDLYSGKYGI